MRTVLVTGPGGAGRTTLAAATALAAARAGTPTLLLTPGPGPLGLPAGPEPTAPAPGLHVVAADPAATFRDGVRGLQDRAGALLGLLGATPLEDGELAPPPGLAPYALLTALHRHATAAYGLLVVDLPAGTDGLGLLAAPALLRRYLDRLLPRQRQAARALRPVLGKLAGVPLPGGEWYEAAARAEAALAASEALLTGPGTSLLPVVEPGRAGTEALRLTRVAASLHGVALDRPLANRVLPEGAFGAAAQRAALRTYEDVREIPHLGAEPADLAGLEALGVPPPGEPAEAPEWTLHDLRARTGLVEWHVPLPGAERGELDLYRFEDELAVTAGPFRRTRPLPSALRRCDVTGAALREDVLRVRFRPTPGLWPEG
ncbi:ArsA-related P-loop ATPase [Streptomyces sp. NPDC004959]|uniref:ArsA family ATPase n=1 Tax=unclassified Streptomyces TaxID=2593676 RepID=UPI0004CA928A|nr:ArsA-related P-loop ATPase [Streptomyces sp. NRRL F-5630]